MELKETINKLFEMTDEQRTEVFGVSSVESILDNYYTNAIIENIENYFTPSPKYGDVYVNKDGDKKAIVLRYGYYCYYLTNEHECPQKMTPKNFLTYYTRTGKNVADKLKELFE